MDKERAARILAKELGDKLGRAAVIEDSYKDNLLRGALAVYQVGDPVNLDFSDGKFQLKGNNGENIIDVLLAPHLGKYSFTEANYCFLENIHVKSSQYSGGLSRFAATPYALIGEKEKTALRRLFYKNVQPEIAYAMDMLGIENFMRPYKDYYNKSDSCFLQFCEVPNSLETLNKFVSFAKGLKYDKDHEVKLTEFDTIGGVGLLNKLFGEVGMTASIVPNRDGRSYVHGGTIEGVIYQVLGAINKIKDNTSLRSEFIDFIFFYLPPEEQNIEANKRILKESPKLDFVVSALCKEYKDGSHFRDYFDVLGKEVQEDVISALKALPSKNPAHNSFLWSKGFKDIELDYFKLYKEDAKGFVDYFCSRGADEKKFIIKDIMDCDFVNEEVVNWLNGHERELVREAGLDG